jgi:hypothetical protein
MVPGEWAPSVQNKSDACNDGPRNPCIWQPSDRYLPIRWVCLEVIWVTELERAVTGVLQILDSCPQNGRRRAPIAFLPFELLIHRLGTITSEVRHSRTYITSKSLRCYDIDRLTTAQRKPRLCRARFSIHHPYPVKVTHFGSSTSVPRRAIVSSTAIGLSWC